MEHPSQEIVDRVRREYERGKPISELLEIICQAVDSTSPILCVLYIKTAFDIRIGEASWVAESEVVRSGGLTSQQLQEKLGPVIENRKKST